MRPQTLKVRILGLEFNMTYKINPRKSMYIVAFGIWSNVFLLYRDIILSNLPTRLSQP